MSISGVRADQDQRWIRRKLGAESELPCKVDDKGLLRWAKNDEKLDDDTVKDSEKGIAKIDDEEAHEVPLWEEGPSLERSSID